MICTRPDIHRFHFQDIWIERMVGVGNRNIMHYNGWTPDGKYGEKGPPWYRFSQIRGLRSWEYSEPIGGKDVVKGFKPIETGCDCWPKILKVGRFGAWHSTDPYPSRLRRGS